MPRKRTTKANMLDQPFGLTYDVLHELRRAMRILRRAEGWMVKEHRAEKRRAKTRSDEWEESQRIRRAARDQEAQ